MVVGEFTQETQLVVIGGGPGGYSAAFHAAELGIETVLVDARDQLGGVCLHEGCIPSKTLLHIVETLRSAERASQFGVRFGKPQLDIDAIRAWMDQSISKLAGGLKQLCKRHGVEHIQGTASFEDGRRLNVRDSAIPRIRFRRAIIATGSVPMKHPVLEEDGRVVLTPHQAIRIEQIPKSLLIVGSNYNAVELASIYAAFGSEVTLVFDDKQVLPDADADLVRPLAASLKAQLKNMCPGTRVTDARRKDDAIEVAFEGAKLDATRFDQVIVSIGYRANVDSLAIDRTVARIDEFGFIEVDDQMRTQDQRVFAVGDVAASNQRRELLADRALAQGRVAAEVIAGWNAHLDLRAVPVAVFTDPQIAWCGLTELQAKQAEIPYLVTKQSWGVSGKAVGMGRTDGVTKIIYDPDTQLVLGMGIAGPHASELIAEGALAIEMGAVITDLASIIHPHPTLAEMYSDAALRVEQHFENRH